MNKNALKCELWIFSAAHFLISASDFPIFLCRKKQVKNLIKMLIST